MSDTFSKVEVITGVARRRRFPIELKLALVAETMLPGMSVSYVARRHGLSPSLLFRWRRLMSEGAREETRADRRGRHRRCRRCDCFCAGEIYTVLLLPNGSCRRFRCRRVHHRRASVVIANASHGISLAMPGGTHDRATPRSDPDVILSHHPARATERRPPPSVEKRGLFLLPA